MNQATFKLFLNYMPIQTKKHAAYYAMKVGAALGAFS